MNTMLVTGAAGHLGSAVCYAAQAAGWNVIAIDRLDVDLLSTDDVAAYIAANVSELHAVVHTVGGIRAGQPVGTAPVADAHDMMELNYRTTVNVANAVAPLLKRSMGCFVGIGAQACVHPTVNKAYYAASKAAVIALVQAMAEEGRSYGMRANVIVPSILRTPANESWAQGNEADTWVEPSQVANTIVSICSPHNLTSGAIIPMFGGVPF